MKYLLPRLKTKIKEKAKVLSLHGLQSAESAFLGYRLFSVFRNVVKQGLSCLIFSHHCYNFMQPFYHLFFDIWHTNCPVCILARFESPSESHTPSHICKVPVSLPEAAHQTYSKVTFAHFLWLLLNKETP